MPDDEAFRAFATRLVPNLQRSAYLLCGDWQIAEDLVQNTLTNVYVHWRRVTSADSPDAYVQGMLISAARSRWRRTADRPFVGPIPNGEPAADDDHAVAIVQRDALLTALLELPLGERAVVVLRHLLGFSQAETATALGVSVGTVKSQTSRALVALRRHLSEESKT